MSDENVSVWDVVSLIEIAVILFIGEGLRLIYCYVTRQQYKPPTYRIVEGSQSGGQEDVGENDG